MKALIAAGAGDVYAAPLDILGKAGRTGMRHAIEYAKIGKLGPRFKAFIDASQEGDILRIVRTHFPPGFRIAIHTAAPEFGACIWYLTADPEIAAEVIKLIGIELECPPSDLEGVYCFVRRGWSKAVNGQAGR